MIQRIWCQVNGHEDGTDWTGEVFCRFCGQLAPQCMQLGPTARVIALVDKIVSVFAQFGVAAAEAAANLERALQRWARKDKGAA